ncbi:MAG TPA: tRNA pseudouridine(38-40) synthase TruA [Acidimicrobiia bacterium]|nr:tRNA pseudouridine(38-40) synthase TruA [Acidimicrobiia bacterium]
MARTPEGGAVSDATLFDVPGGARPRVKLVVAYDGTDFRGFAAQRDVRTVEGVLSKALEKVVRHEVDLTCAGRTDAGVHARGQVVTFEAEPGIDPWHLQKALNGMLAPEVVVRSADLVAPEFDARRSAIWRHYRYTVVNRPVPDPFLARYAWWVPEPLDLRAMRLAADPFVGEHDFTSFCRKGPEGSTRTRTVMESRWDEVGAGVLVYEIRAVAFCWQMVRSIVGTQVDAGTGKLRPGDMLSILGARDRQAAGQVAPPHGLCLWEVGYPG